MMNYTFSREVAVKEGLRDNDRINYDESKRPYLTIKVDMDADEKKLFNKKLENAFSSRPIDITKIKYLCRSVFKDAKDHRQVNKWLKSNKYIGFNHLEEASSFKDKVMMVYVESQYSKKYKLRDLRNKKVDEIVEIELDKFYDIAGKVVYINLSKINGKYEVIKIINKY